MNDWNIEAVSGLLGRAGEIAMRHYDNPSGEIKGDFSVVTAADKEIEAFFAGHFDRPGEAVYMIGEETCQEKDENYVGEALRGTTWVVDPIDGTAPYYNHIQTWGISVALMKNGRILEGAIYMPALDEFHITENGRVFSSKSFSRTGTAGLQPLVSRKMRFDDGALVGVSQLLAKRGRFTARNPVQALCCCVYSMCYLAQGSYLGYHVTAKLWDIAAGLVILKNCGIKGYFSSGREFTLDVTPGQYDLGADPRKRWKIKDSLIFAADWERADYIFKHMETPPLS